MHDKADKMVVIMIAVMDKAASPDVEVTVKICQPEETVYNTLPMEFLAMDWIPEEKKTVKLDVQGANEFTEAYYDDAILGYTVYQQNYNVFDGLGDGDSVTVTWDGVDYRCVVAESVLYTSRILACGNFGYMSSIFRTYVDTRYSADVPFCVICIIAEDGEAITGFSAGNDPSSSHNIRISKNDSETLPDAFQPTGYPDGGNQLLFAASNHGGLNVYIYNPPLVLEKYRAYGVTIDGRAYTCTTVIATDGTIVLGNPALYKDGELDNGVPFCVYNDDSDFKVGFGVDKNVFSDQLKDEYQSLFLRVYASPIRQMASEFIPNDVWDRIAKAQFNRENQLDVLKAVYPVGALYLSANAGDPATLFGFGTWEQIKDTFLLASGDTYSAGASGGEASHTLSVSELPDHKHYIASEASGIHDIPAWTLQLKSGTYTSSSAAQEDVGCGYSAGVVEDTLGQAHNNMPPYLVVYVWKRTA